MGMPRMGIAMEEVRKEGWRKRKAKQIGYYFGTWQD